MVLLLSGSALGAAVALSSSTAAHKPLVAPAANQLPPLSNLAARAVWCGDAYNASGHGGCHSPDGKWAIVVENEGRGCTMTVTRLGTGRRERISQARGSCAPDLWIGHSFVVQEDIYGSHGRVVSLDPPSRNPKVLARFSSFVVSPNKRWIAGQAGSGEPFGARVVAVMSLASHTCRVVAEAKSPDQNVSVNKSPWSIRTEPSTSGPYKDPVFWRTVVQGGKKIRVVSGPGTGFTRNSRSLIVAKWQTSQTPPPYAIHKRLVKYNLSSLHTRCPTSLAPHR
jgi:hypothetical protein